MRAVDTAVVLSEKDRALLARRGGSARVVVVLPPLDDVEMPSGPDLGAVKGAEVLFVGALWRPENEDAAIWLLEDIWPEIRAKVPGVRLTIAGARPGPVIQAAARHHEDVELTGYVPSLRPYYQRATLVVAPIRLGAGVQLKTVVAMMWGLPVVATSLAAEGVAGPSVFLAVENRALSFAQAVVGAIRSPGAADDVRRRAFIWSHEHYSAAAYLRALNDVYLEQ